MSADCWAKITVHACPSEYLDEVKGLLENEEFEGLPDGDEPISLGETYARYECYSDLAETISDALGEISDDIAHAVTCGWGSDYSGFVIRYHPSLGKFEATLDGDGQVVFTIEEIVEMRTLDDEAFDLASGRPWLAAFEAASGDDPTTDATSAAAVLTPEAVR